MNLWSYIYFVFLVTALLIYALEIRKKEYYSRLIFVYLLILLLTDLLAIAVLVVWKLKNNLFIFHVFTPLEYAIFSLLYLNQIQSPRVKKVIRASIPGFIGLSILFSAFVQHPDINNSYVMIMESILLSTWCLLFLREAILYPTVSYLQRYPMFWISVGILFYFVGDIFVEGLLNYLVKHSMTMAIRFYNMETIFKFIFFALVIVGIKCQSIFRLNKATEIKLG
jgi:hypothetical protein